MRKRLKCCTDFLFARPSFVSGMARTLDLHGDLNRYNISVTGEEADLKGLVCDWLMVQADLQNSWAMVLDRNPELLKDIAEAISRDVYLRNAVLHHVSQESNKHEFEMATQGA